MKLCQQAQQYNCYPFSLAWYFKINFIFWKSSLMYFGMYEQTPYNVLTNTLPEGDIFWRQMHNIPFLPTIRVLAWNVRHICFVLEKNSIYWGRLYIERKKKFMKQFPPCYLIWILIDKLLQQWQTGRNQWLKRAKKDITRQLPYHLKCIFHCSYIVLHKLCTECGEGIAKSHDQNKADTIPIDNGASFSFLTELEQWGIEFANRRMPLLTISDQQN